jgi:hypothetical protein
MGMLMTVATNLDHYTIDGELPAGDSFTVRFTTPGNPDEILAQSQQFDIIAENPVTTTAGENTGAIPSNGNNVGQEIEGPTVRTNPDISQTAPSTTFGEFRPVPQVVTTVTSSETETSDIATATVGEDSSTVKSSGGITSSASSSGFGTVTSSGLGTVTSSGSGAVASGTSAPSHKASGAVGRGWFLGDAWGVGLFIAVAIGVVVA